MYSRLRGDSTGGLGLKRKMSAEWSCWRKLIASAFAPLGRGHCVLTAPPYPKTRPHLRFAQRARHTLTATGRGGPGRGIASRRLSQEWHHAVHPTGPAVRVRRARTAHRRQDDGDPLAEAPQGLRGQPEQGARIGARTSRTSTSSQLLRDIKKVPDAIRQAVINNGGGHHNHSLFWEIMGPGGGGEPTGPDRRRHQGRVRRLRQVQGHREEQRPHAVRQRLELGRRQPDERQARSDQASRTRTAR